MYIKGSLSEFDIKSCNANVSLQEGFIDQAFYDYLVSLDKESRVVYYGEHMNDNPHLKVSLGEAIEKYVNEFKKMNSLEEHNIVDVIKDAVWTLDVIPKYCNFGDHVEFVRKQRFTSAIIFRQNFAFYLNSEDGNFAIRGIKNPEQDFMMSFFKRAMMMKELGETMKLHDYVHTTRLDYVRKPTEAKRKPILRGKENTEEILKDSNLILIERFIKELL